MAEEYETDQLEDNLRILSERVEEFRKLAERLAEFAREIGPAWSALYESAITVTDLARAARLEHSAK